MLQTARLKRAAERLLPPSVRARREEQRRQERARVKEDRRLARIAQRRAALLESEPDLRTITLGDTEHLGRLVQDFSVERTADRNLDLVLQALEHARIDHFLVPGRSSLRHVLGVHRSQRKALLEAMRELHGDSALYAIRPGPGGSTAQTSAYVDGALADDIKNGLIIRFAELLISAHGDVFGGFEYGCDIEFWRDASKVMASEGAPHALDRLRVKIPQKAMEGALLGPRPNRIADVLTEDVRRPATLTVGDRTLPTFEPFAHRHAEDVGFPVDVVYTWVDGADPEHASKRARYRDEAGELASHAANVSRYTDHEELRYSLRSLQMYAPFVRDVYVVTDAQVPSWLDTEAPGITVVDHRDIFADPNVLPVFSSRAIETQLHRIAGLSERYLYLNDDVFFAAPVGAEYFFHSNGIARVPFSGHQIGVADPIAEEVAPNWAGKNARALLLKDFGATITQKIRHAPLPQLRQVHRELEERYRQDIERTARSRFRHPQDIAPATTLHQYYALFTGRGVRGDYRTRYVDIGTDHAHEDLIALAEMGSDAPFDFLCLNDFDTPPERQEEVSRMLADFLERRFPFPSRFERVQTGTGREEPGITEAAA